MSLDVWRHTLRAIVDYAKLAEVQLGIPVVSDIIWHGGEPLLLPPAYFHNVLELQAEIIPEEWIDQGKIRNCIQTNLYSINDAQIDLLKHYDFRLGVSFDFIGGVRVATRGCDTESQVRRNMRRLDNHFIPYQLITVLAYHTASNVNQVFQGIQEIDVPTRLLPLFEGPSSRDMRNVELSRSTMLAAMLRMFELWFDAGMRPKIRPFDEAVEAVVMKRLGLKRPRQDRRRLANEVLVVDRDGSLSSASQRDSWSIGNITTHSIDEIIRSHAYIDQVTQEATLKQLVCDGCEFLGPCDTSPITSNFDTFIFNQCIIERPFFTSVETFLDSRGLLDSDFMRTGQAVVVAYLQNELSHSAADGRNGT